MVAGTAVLSAGKPSWVDGQIRLFGRLICNWIRKFQVELLEEEVKCLPLGCNNVGNLGLRHDELSRDHKNNRITA